MTRYIVILLISDHFLQVKFHLHFLVHSWHDIFFILFKSSFVWFMLSYKTLENSKGQSKPLELRCVLQVVHCTYCAEWFQYQATNRVNDTLNTEGIYQPLSKSSTLSLLYWTTDQTVGQLNIKMRGNCNWCSFGLSKMCVFNSPKLGCLGVCKSSAVQVGSDRLWSDSRGIKVSSLQTSWEPISLLARSAKVNLRHPRSFTSSFPL